MLMPSKGWPWKLPVFVPSVAATQDHFVFHLSGGINGRVLGAIHMVIVADQVPTDFAIILCMSPEWNIHHGFHVILGLCA